jgi:hypothetical protein
VSKYQKDQWVENEIKLALEKESTGNPIDDQLMKLCYDSASKAYSVIKEGQSGMSMSLTKFILNRLIDRKPLTTITEKDFEGLEPLDWQDWYLNKKGLKEIYQCPRCASLFKHVYLDGRIKYVDNDRVETIDRNGASCLSSIGTEAVDNLRPLVLPYYPGRPYKVYTAEFTYDPDNGNISIDPGIYNSIYLSHVITSDGKKISLKEWYFEKGVPENCDLSSLGDKLLEALRESGLPTNLVEF